jgi:hypothetical protein
MDPLSISASVAGLLTLTQAVATAIFKYVKEVKGAGKDVLSMLEETDQLVGVLSQLEHVISRYEIESIDILWKPIHSCQLLLERIKQKLGIDDSALGTHSSNVSTGKVHLQHRILTMSRAIAWPFSKVETESMFTKVREYKQTLSLALATDGM